MSHPYEQLPPRQYWRNSRSAWLAEDFSNIYVPKFPIGSGTAVATAGSCFAQHISRNLRSRGFNFVDVEPAPSLLPAELHSRFGYSLYSARYGNIYTARQLHQLVDSAFEIGNNQECWQNEGRFYDALRPSIEPSGFSSFDEYAVQRLAHIVAVRKMFETAKVFVFTLGLTEAWVNKSSGLVYPSCPGTVAGLFDPMSHGFTNFGYRDVFKDMKEVIFKLRGFNKKLKFILTVSPVPLAATATNNDVVVASSYSKSVLRSVAGELCDRFSFVDYFPSYELITSHLMGGRAYENNKREVKSEAVSGVMECFFGAHQPAVSGVLSRAESDDDDEAAVNKEAAVVCDEAILDTFAR